MNKIDIRIATADDIKIITDFQVTMALESENMVLDREVVLRGVTAVMSDEAHYKGVYYLAEKEGEVIGCLMITKEWSDWRAGWVWWIQSLYVLPQHRRHGVFRTMYDFLKKTIYNSDDVRGIRLYVDKRNVRAQKAYESIGMNGEHYTTYEWMK